MKIQIFFYLFQCIIKSKKLRKKNERSRIFYNYLTQKIQIEKDFDISKEFGEIL